MSLQALESSVSEGVLRSPVGRVPDKSKNMFSTQRALRIMLAYV